MYVELCIGMVVWVERAGWVRRTGVYRYWVLSRCVDESIAASGDGGRGREEKGERRGFERGGIRGGFGE